MAGITITVSRSKACAFTHPYHTEPSVVAIKVGANKSLYFIRPFKLSLFVVFLSLPIVLSFALLAAEVCLQNVHHPGRQFGIKPSMLWFCDIVFCFARKLFTSGTGASLNTPNN